MYKRQVYYIGKMRAGELIDNVGFAAELPEWSEMTADEKMQRQPDITRVINEIVPYVIEDPDRFFKMCIRDRCREVANKPVNENTLKLLLEPQNLGGKTPYFGIVRTAAEQLQLINTCLLYTSLLRTCILSGWILLRMRRIICKKVC